MNKEATPRQFRNALYEHLVSHGVTEETAATIAGEAELYVEAYEAYKLRGIEFAARSMGFDMKPRTDGDGTRP